MVIFKTKWKTAAKHIFIILFCLPHSLSAASGDETCRSLQNSESEKIFCKLDNSPISCENPPNHTTAVVVCQSYYIFPELLPVYKCINGNWNKPFTKCTMECGTKRIAGTTSTTGSSTALKNEYPWVVAVYNKDDKFMCGGTLISEHFVLSGAVCFADNRGIPRPKDEYTIIAGKHYRDINSTEDSGSQRRKVKSIHVHENFRGNLHRYRDDIALVELDGKITISLEVQPICIDWDNDLEVIDFVSGKTGEFAGWGYITPEGPPSDVLKKLKLAFQARDICSESLGADFSQIYYTNDKFCAGYKNKNIGVCNGDSGGGLYFKSDGMHYFIRGILSLSPRTDNGCNINNFALYTKISSYLPWIKNITGSQ